MIPVTPSAQAQSLAAVPEEGLTDAALVADVVALIEQTLGDLAGQWVELSSTITPRPEVLHTDSILELLRGFTATPGKLIRPRMAYWGWVAGGGRDDDPARAHVVRVGAALELLHCFALVHDDVMDASDTRRGHPSVHALARAEHASHDALGDAQRYGESIAILVGDLLHSEADQLIGGLPRRLRAAWRTLAVELMLGQGRDLVGAANGRRDLAHAREVARVKSGAYTVWRPLQLGALAADAPPQAAAALSEYGHHAGLAFALRDDVLGVFGDPARTGKPAGDDLTAGKPTVLLALAERRFGPAGRLALRRVGGGGEPADVELLRSELVASGVLDEVEELIVQAVADAERALDSPWLDARAAPGLRRLLHRLAWRNT